MRLLNYRLVIKILVISSLLITNYLLYKQFIKTPIGNIQTSVDLTPDSLEKIQKDIENSNNLVDFFTDMAVTNGAPYAFEVLKVVTLPPNQDTHLLGHAVGDILYQQRG